MAGLRSNRMNTSIERVFRPMPGGVFREIYLHYINFLDENGDILSSKLDKTIEGKLFKIAQGNERSLYGEVEYQFPGTDKPVRLVALSVDYGDLRYGRF